MQIVLQKYDANTICPISLKCEETFTCYYSEGEHEGTHLTGSQPACHWNHQHLHLMTSADSCKLWNVLKRHSLNTQQKMMVIDAIVENIVDMNHQCKLWNIPQHHLLNTLKCMDKVSLLVYNFSIIISTFIFVFLQHVIQAISECCHMIGILFTTTCVAWIIHFVISLQFTCANNNL